MDTAEALHQARGAAEQHDGLVLLLLHSSRAHGTAHATSDWDFAYLGDERVYPFALHADLTDLLGTNDVDLADLDSASGLLRYRAALNGIVIYEARAGVFHDFAVKAATFCYDARPAIEAGNRRLLARLTER